MNAETALRIRPNRSMPDVASQSHQGRRGRLDWVGMAEIELPVSVPDGAGRLSPGLARIQAYVNLADPDAKGIHMSRLYLELDRELAQAELTASRLDAILGRFIDSHAGLADRALLECRLDFHARRESLLSGHAGWKNYPLRVLAMRDARGLSLEMEVEVTYSSTCPCSAALSRQLIQEGFAERFGEDGRADVAEVGEWLGTAEAIRATPHSQRSVAQVRVRLDPGCEHLPVARLIDDVEAGLKTPVQAAVKREDEQEFARLNGENLMFCEDAARNIRAVLDGDDALSDFRVRVNHMESLHPHNAVAVVTKGVPGGFDDAPGHFGR